MRLKDHAQRVIIWVTIAAVLAFYVVIKNLLSK